MSDVRLHIDRLVLEGVPLSRSESAVLGQAVGAELTRLVSEGGLQPRNLPSPSARPLSASQLSFDSAAGPEAWGVQIAQSVYGTLSSGPNPSQGGGKRR